MMDIFNALGGMDTAQQQVSQQLGTDPNQTAAALEAAVPLLLGAVTRNAQTPEGAAALDNALNQHEGDALGLFGQGQMPDLNEGQKILGHVFGNQQSNAVQAVAQRAGISPQLAMQILMMAAPLVLNYLARQRGGAASSGMGGGIGSVLGSILGGNMGGGLGSVLGSVLGGSMGSSMGGAGGGLGSVLGSVLGGSQQAQPQDYQQSQGGVLGGGSVIPGYPADNSAGTTVGMQQSQTQGADLGGLVGTLNNVLDSNHNGNALDDLIGMFGGRRS